MGPGLPGARVVHQLEKVRRYGHALTDPKRGLKRTAHAALGREAQETVGEILPDRAETM